MVRKSKEKKERSYEDEQYLREKMELTKNSHVSDKILVLLLDEEMGFDQIVRRTGNSRGTVNTHLSVLYAKGSVQYKNPTAREGKSRPYCLTAKGRKEAEEVLPATFFRSLSNKQLSQFMFTYKLLIAYRIYQTFLNRVTMTRENEALFFKQNRLIIQNQAKLVEAIEADLRSHRYSENQIYKLWLMQQGYNLLFIIEYLGSPEFFKLFVVPIPLEKCDESKRQSWKKLVDSLLNNFETNVNMGAQWGHYSNHPTVILRQDGKREIIKDGKTKILEPDEDY